MSRPVDGIVPSLVVVVQTCRLANRFALDKRRPTRVLTSVKQLLPIPNAL